MKTNELPALEELREGLREAARRDVAARRPKRRRRRGLAVVVVVLLGGAAAAGAAELISSGEPVHDERQVPQRYHPSTQVQLAVTAKDEPLDWGVGVYTTTAGQECALVGRVRGATLGELRDGVFHAYVPGRAGLCGRTDGPALGFFDFTRRQGKTVVYGRVKPDAKSVAVVVDGKPYPVRTGDGGAFVLVFEGNVVPSRIVSG
jgi:hypothetical protein